VPLGLEFQDGDEVGSVDGGFIFGPFGVAESSLVGFLAKDVESGLYCGIDAEVQKALG
jgi:hypothetical protein